MKVSKCAIIFFLIVLFFLFISPLQASLITLSTNSSNNNAIDPTLLDASLDFSVTGSQLTLTVTNNTDLNPDNKNFKIKEIYFNLSDNITDLSLVDVTGISQNVNKWNLTVNKDSISVDSFGQFDVSLIDGIGVSNGAIQKGKSATFILDITGSGPFTDEDFSTHLSIQTTYNSYAAAFFDEGPDNSSTFGAVTIPEPMTCLLFAAGSVLILKKRRA